MSKENYIKKLEQRIHNQRVALRENWQIAEMRLKERCTPYSHPLRDKWWDYVIKSIAERKALKAEVKRLKEKCGEI